MEEEREHARCAPSDYDGWSVCHGKVAMEEGEPDYASSDSIGGTLAHEAARLMLVNNTTRVPVLEGLNDEYHEAIVLYVTACRNRIAEYKAAGAKAVHALYEVRLDISPITTETKARGTADCVLIAEWDDHSVLEVRDAKFGIGVVVEVDGNGQLQVYALAALLQHQLLHRFTEVNLVIHQPRVHPAPREWRTTVEDLHAFGAQATKHASLALSILEGGPITAAKYLVPGEKQCRFCKAKHKCPALAQTVHDAVFGEFQAIDDPAAVPLTVADQAQTPEQKTALLSTFMARIPLIETWVKQIRATVERELLEGHAVPGFKLVQGRRGARQWTDAEAVEKLLLGAQRDPAEIFQPRALKTPTQLEKVLAKAPVWQPLLALTKQSEGQPSVAPADDPRPPFTVQTAAEFDTFDGSDLV
jgi:hypothetical protein